MRIHWGSGRFCFAFFPKIFFTLKVLLDGCGGENVSVSPSSSRRLARASPPGAFRACHPPRDLVPFAVDAARSRRRRRAKTSRAKRHIVSAPDRSSSTLARASTRAHQPRSTASIAPARPHPPRHRRRASRESTRETTTREDDARARRAFRSIVRVARAYHDVVRLKEASADARRSNSTQTRLESPGTRGES